MSTGGGSGVLADAAPSPELSTQKPDTVHVPSPHVGSSFGSSHGFSTETSRVAFAIFAASSTQRYATV